MACARYEMPETKHQTANAHYESVDFRWQSGSGRLECHQWRQTKPIQQGSEPLSKYEARNPKSETNSKCEGFK